MALEICSLNIQGLRGHIKRKSLFHWLCQKKWNIIFLQETHSTNNDEDKWKKEWGGDIYFSHGTNTSRGVAILIRGNTDLHIVDEYADPTGRALYLKSKIHDNDVIIANIYGPNTDDATFFDQLTLKLIEYENCSTILGGDFNLVLDTKLDKCGGLPQTHEKCLKSLKCYMKNHNMVDIWRILHPNLKKYTWRRQNPTPVHCRLDFFLISDSLCGTTCHASISPGFRSDHSLISIKINLAHVENGPGFWKLNCSLLADDIYVRGIKSLLREGKNRHKNINDLLYWEMIKMDIRGYTISYSTYKKKNKIKEQSAIENEIEQLEQKFELSTVESTNLSQLKYKLNSILEDSYKAAMIRCHTKIYEHGERPSKYFLNLERKLQSKKVLNKLEIIREIW